MVLYKSMNESTEQRPVFPPTYVEQREGWVKVSKPVFYKLKSEIMLRD